MIIFLWFSFDNAVVNGLGDLWFYIDLQKYTKLSLQPLLKLTFVLGKTPPSLMFFKKKHNFLYLLQI